MSSESTALAPVEAATGEVIVSTRFMEQYEIVRAVSGGTELFPFENASGNLDVYSVGTANRVFRIHPETASETAWSDEDLGITATQLSPYTLDGPSDRPNILGIDAERKLSLSKWDGLRYVQTVSQPPKATAKLAQFRSAQAQRNVYANVILDTGEVATNFLKPDGSWATADWVRLRQKDGSNETAKAKRIAMCANNPVQTSLYAIGLDDAVLFAETPFSVSYFTQLGKLQAIDITVVLDSQKLLNIFAVDINHFLWQKKQKKYSASGNIEWEDWTQLDSRYKLASLRAQVNYAGAVEVFAIGDDGSLYYTRQLLDAKGAPVAWSTLFPLGNPVPNSIFSAGRTRSGYSQAFSVTRDNRLYRFWQDPQTTQWYNAEIAVRVTGEMTAVPAHSIEMQILDAGGYPRSDSPVTITTSTLVALRINGLYYIVSEHEAAHVKSDPGSMVIIERFTDSLTSPTLNVVTEFMEAGESVAVEPNAALQDKLYTTTPADVLDARGANGEYLLSGTNRTPENAESIANIMRQSMSLGMPPAGAVKSTRYIGRNLRTTGLRHVRKGHSPFRLVPQEVPEQHWRVDFSDGFPRYQELTREEAALHLETKDALLAAGGGFFGVGWGELWNSVKEGASWIFGGIKDFVISTIVDPITGLVDKIRSVFTLIIDGIEKAFDLVIEAFQQAFDIIEGIWNSIKVFFVDLYNWLAFFFEWDDIKRTAEVVEHTFNATVGFLGVAMRDLRQQVEAGFDNFESQVKTWFDDYIATIVPNTTTGGMIAASSPPGTAQLPGASHNVLSNAYMSNFPKAPDTPPGLLRSAAVSEVMEKAAAELTALAENFQFGTGKQEFDAALEYFKSAGNDPSKFFDYLWAGLVKLMEALALWGIAVARGVALSVIDVLITAVEAVHELFNEEWEIPFVSPLWKLITGKSLSFRPIEIFSYMAAIPATLTYKIFENKAPFPDQASVDRFKAFYTTEWLAQQAGIGPENKKKKTRELAASATVDDLQIWQKVFASLFAGVYVLMTVVDTAQAYYTYKNDPEKPAPKYLGYLFVGGRYLQGFFTTPWLTTEDAGAPSCTNGKGLNNLRWCLNLVFGPTRGLVFLLIRDLSGRGGVRKVKIPSWVGESTLSLWGAANLGMAIAVSTSGIWDAKQISVNILSTLGPQMFRFCAIQQVANATKLASLVLLGAGIVSYFAIAGLQLAIAFGKSADAEEVQTRMVRLGFAC
ncbi:MAG TPA: hypothetical protein VE010_15280 [Thermoanaerobaculia bacterium]|nr:hypothetical protein [Thermoanaerobaculia bacterium]